MSMPFGWSAVASRGTVAALCLVLAACGGGDSRGSAPAATPQPVPQPSPAPAPVATICVAPPALADGVFGATLSPSGEMMVMITRNLDDWGDELGPVVFIGAETGAEFVPTTAGRVRSTCQTGNEAPRNIWLFGEDALLTATIDPAMPSMSGEITSGTTTRAFVGGRIPGSDYNYRQAAALTSAVGTLEQAGSAPGQGLSLTVRADGTATLSRPGGTATSGRVDPTGVGKLRLSFAPSGASTYQFEGVLVAYETANGGRRLFAYLFGSDGWDWTELFLTGSLP